jgi:hypothetical protein
LRPAAAKRNEYHQGKLNHPLRLIVVSTTTLMIRTRYQWDLEEPMAFVMAIESEAFASCVEKIDVSIEEKNVSAWFCCG